MWFYGKSEVGEAKRPLVISLVIGHDRYWKDEGLREVYSRPQNKDRWNSTFSRYFQFVAFLLFFGFIVSIESPSHGTSLKLLWGVPKESEVDGLRVTFSNSFIIQKTQRFVHKEFSAGKPNPWQFYSGRW